MAVKEDKLAQLTEVCSKLIELLGEDVARPGLLDTPSRMAKALTFLTSGGGDEGATEAAGDALFPVDPDDQAMVLVRDIDMYSLCEHHVLPFHGKVHIGYIPNGKVLGLSKLARVTDAHSRMLQLQERLTSDVAGSIERLAAPRGVAVLVEATHMCMSMRGVCKTGSTTVTTAFRGCFRSDAALQAAFLSQIKSS